MTQIPQNHKQSIKWLYIFVIFTLFPQEDSLGLFSVIRDIIRNQISVEFAFVAISVRSFHKMLVLIVDNPF